MSSPSDHAPDSSGEAGPGLGPHLSAAPPVGRRGSRATSTAVLLVSAALYSLLVAGILFVLGVLFQLGDIEASLPVGLSLCALLVGAHWAQLAVLRRIDLPRPGATTALLTASVVLLFGQTALVSFAFDGGTFLSVPGAAFLQGLVIGVVLAMSRRRAFTRVFVAVCVFLLLRSLTSLGLAALDAHQERQRDLEALATYPYEIAVLDAPDWTPVSVNTGHGDDRMVLIYENADGDGVKLTTWGSYVPDVAPDRPMWAWCEGYGRECVQTPEGIVLSESEEGVRAADVARVEVAPGRVAVVEQQPDPFPGSPRGRTLPDISLDELGELAERVRIAEEGEVEEIVERTG